MSNFAAAAYLVFALLLAWDYVAPRLRLRRALREVAARATREAARASSKPTPSKSPEA